NIVENPMENADFFELGGITMPREELHAIHISMKKLAKRHNLWKARLFGKIFGIAGNYIICETSRVKGIQSHLGVSQQGATKEPEHPLEHPGVGVNMAHYWVCSKPGDEWLLRPDVTPSQIVAGRRIRKFLSSKLHKPLR